MDRSLPPERVQEILDEAHRSPDLPAGRLVITAEAIRDALHDARSRTAPPAFMGVGRPARPPTEVGSVPARRGGARTVLVAATLAATTVLAGAVAGALPAPIQSQVASGAALLGITLPTERTEPQVRVESPNLVARTTPDRGPARRVDQGEAEGAADTATTVADPAGSDLDAEGTAEKDSGADHDNGAGNDSKNGGKGPDPERRREDPGKPGSGKGSQGGGKSNRISPDPGGNG